MDTKPRDCGRWRKSCGNLRTWPLWRRVGNAVGSPVFDTAATIVCHKIAENEWAVDGTPADCVIVALHKLLPERPDLVISGINHGANLGENVYYSGTVGAARRP